MGLDACISYIEPGESPDYFGETVGESEHIGSYGWVNTVRRAVNRLCKGDFETLLSLSDCDGRYDYDTIIKLKAELEEAIAQLKRAKDRAVTAIRKDGSRTFHHIYGEFGGTNGNSHYSYGTGACPRGIVVVLKKKTIGVFDHIWRKDGKVFGHRILSMAPGLEEEVLEMSIQAPPDTAFIQTDEVIEFPKNEWGAWGEFDPIRAYLFSSNETPVEELRFEYPEGMTAYDIYGNSLEAWLRLCRTAIEAVEDGMSKENIYLVHY